MNPTPTKTTKGSNDHEAQAATEAAKKPARDDVHEQRQANQKQEGVVVKKDPRPPTQSQADQERGDWEGMGQSRHQPDEPSPTPAANPTPGSGSHAGKKG